MEKITFKGQTKTLKDWAKYLKLPFNVFEKMLEYGFTLEGQDRLKTQPTEIDWQGKNYCVMIRKRDNPLKNTLPEEIRKKYAGKQIIKISSNGPDRFFAIGECLKCPAKIVWDSQFKDSIPRCGYKQWFLGKSQQVKDMVQCSLVKKCPLAKYPSGKQRS